MTPEERIADLQDQVRQLRRDLETQTKVADTFKQCLTDTYRPHIEENKRLLGLIPWYEAELTRLREATS